MPRIVKKMHFISRHIVRDFPNSIFLFGDNLIGSGFGGQAAEMRGEPNTIGIPTKRLPSMFEDAFFTNADFKIATEAIDRAIAKIPENVVVVIPSAGIGTGLAELEKRAPKIWQYLQQKLNNL